MTTYTFQSASVGAQFRPSEAKDLIRSLTIGDEVQLEREPDNAYDEWAIKVLKDGVHIGYIEAPVAKDWAGFLDDGFEVVSAEILSFLNSLKPHLQVTISDEGGDADGE